MKQLLAALAALVAVASLVIGGCKQTEGDRCQVDADCASGLCNKAKGTCASGTDTEDIDAAVPDAIDGPPMPMDTMSDAPTDAAPVG